MAIGDDASAAGMDLVPGSTLRSDVDRELNKCRDYLANGPTYWKPGITLPVSKLNGQCSIANGGTGQSTAPAARSALGITAPNIPSGVGLASTIQADLDYLSGVANAAIAAANAASSNADGRVSKSGDTMSGHLYVPNAVAATSGFTVAYINGDGRLSRGSSSEKYKKFISEVDPLSFGEVFPGLWRYQMRSVDGLGTDNTWHWGWIAERLAENPATAPFVVYVDGQIESVDFIGLLIVQTAQLDARVTKLEEAA